MGDGPAAGTATRNEAVVREAIAVLAGGDEALASDIVDPDYRDHASGGVERGPQGFLAQRRRMRCPFADVELNARDMVVGDGHVAVRLRFRGLHVGPYAGVEPKHGLAQRAARGTGDRRHARAGVVLEPRYGGL
jgi:hypothetical protein